MFIPKGEVPRLKPGRHCKRALMSHSFFQLEPRLLFDASSADAVDHFDDGGVHVQFPGLAFIHDGNLAPDDAGRDVAKETPVEIFVIDASVRDSAQIEKDLGPDAVLLRLDAKTDGLTVLSEFLSGYRQVDALHIFSHGADGEIRLGSTILNEAALVARSGQIEGWRSAFSDGGDIVLYGCDVAKSGSGQAFATHLATLTGADVAASTDATGSAEKGGNWTLEFRSGEVETAAVAVQDYGDLLGAPHISGVENLLRLGTEDSDMLVQWARIDSSAANIKMTIKADHGTLHLKHTDGLTFEPGHENGTAELRFSGARSDINMALLGHTNDAGGGNSNSMVYRPDANYSGKATLVITAETDASATKTFQLDFAAVNDAPDLSSRVPLSVAEGESAPFSLANLAADENALDPDIASGQQVLAQQMMIVDTLPVHGRLTYKGGLVDRGAVIPVSDLAELRYTHDGTDLTADITDTFDVKVNDGGGGSTPAQLSVTVTPKNVAPVVKQDRISIIEGQIKSVEPEIELGDTADSWANSSIVIDQINPGLSGGAAQGVFFFDADDNNRLDPGEELTGAVTLTQGQRENLSKFKFSHNGAEPDAPGAVPPSYRITVTDGGGGQGGGAALTTIQTVTLAVEPNNDDPALQNSHPDAQRAKIIEEWATVTVDDSMLKVTDVDRDPTDTANTTPAGQLVYTLTGLPQQGELHLRTSDGNWAILGVGGRFTQEDIDAGWVSYKQTMNVPIGPNTPDKFTFTVRDSAFGYAMNDGVPGEIREGAIRDAHGAVSVREFHFSITPKPDQGGVPPVQPTITYNFTPSGSSTNQNITEWNEANVGSPDGYILTKAMLEYKISQKSDSGTPDPADDRTVELSPKETVYTLTTVPGNGKLQKYTGNDWVPMAEGAVFTQADINADKIRFVSDGGEMHQATFEYTVSAGTVEATQKGAFTVKITPTNDRPTAAGGETKVAEGDGNAVRLDVQTIGMADIDTSPDKDALWFRISTLPAHGTLQRWDGVAWVAVQTNEWLSRDILTATADGKASGLRYVHDGTEPLTYADGPRVTFTYEVRDDLSKPSVPFTVDTSPVAGTIAGGGDAQSHLSLQATAAVSILPENDPPVVADKPGDPDLTIPGTIAEGGALQGKNEVLNISEGAFVRIDSGHLTAIDPDNTVVQRQYRITGAPAHGWLFLDEKLLSVGSTFTQKDINDGRIYYWHGGAEPGERTTDGLGSYDDKFHFVISDGVNEDTGDATNNNVFLITVGSPANDKPELKPTKGSMDVFSTGGYEDVPGIGITDSDLDAITTGEKDFLRVEVSVVDAGDSPVPGAKLTYTAADPASGDAHVSGKESNSLVVQGTRAEVQAILNSLRVDPGSDRDSATDKIRIVADDRLRDSSGNFLLVDGKQTANGGRENEAPYNAPDTDKEVNDANNRVTAYITLRSSTTNDAPDIANTTPFRVNEDVELALNGFILSDADSFDKHVTVTVALFRDALRTQPADPATEGKLLLGGTDGVTASGNETNTVTLRGKMADVQNALNALRFQAAADYNGPGAGEGRLYLRSSFTDFSHADTTAGNTAHIDQNIVVVPVNDVPVLEVPGNKTMTENTSIDLNGFDVSDVKDTAQGATDFVKVTLTAKDENAPYGKLNVGDAHGAAVTNDGTAEVTVSGSAAQVKAALNSLKYTPDNTNVDKVITVTVVADDRVAAEGDKGNGAENTGNQATSLGTGNTVTKSFTITVSDTNDAPTVNAPSTVNMSEDSTVVFDGGSGAGHAAKIVFADSDTFSSTNNTVTITVPSGKVAIGNLSGAVISGGADNSGTVTLTGSLANINAALASLRYTPDADYNSTNPVPLTATFNDQGNVGTGGPQTVTTTVNITVDPVNDAPTRSDANPVVLSAIDEDTTEPVGETIGNLVSAKFRDTKDDQAAHGGSDSNAFYGVVVVGMTDESITKGVWQYSDDNGNTWTTIPAVSAASGLVLKADAKVRFLPKADWNGSPTGLTTRLIETGGTMSGTGDRVNVSGANSGGTAIYSDASNAVVINTSVTPVNDPPVAVDDTNSIEENTASVDGNVKPGTVGQDSDPESPSAQLVVTGIRTGTEAEGGAMTAVATGTTGGTGTEIPGRYGTLKIGADGSYVYTLDNGNPKVNFLREGQNLTETFSYTLADPEGKTDTAQLTITIMGKTDGPPSVTPVDGNGGANGQADVYESGLTADGPAGQSRTATGVIELNAPDGLKQVTVAGRTFTAAELAALSAGSPSDVIDTGEGELRLTGLSDVSGTADTLTAARLGYTYVLKAAQSHGGTESTDQIGLTITDQADVARNGVLTVRIVDDIPTARDDAAGMYKTTSTLTGKVVENDRAGADGVTVAGVQAGDSGGADVAGGVGIQIDGAYGRLTLNSDGSYSYQLNPANPAVSGLAHGDLPLTETFSYTIKDADGDASTARLVITISASDVPKAVNDSFSVRPGGTVTSNLSGNDRPSLDGGNVWTLASGPAHGSVTVNADGTFSYTASSGYSGADSFTYTITDADGDTSTATVFIAIDDSPGAVGDSYSTAHNTPVSGSLSGNDRPSLDGGNIWAKTSNPSHGTVTVNPDGTFVYVPTPGYSGTDSFTYRITDADGDTSTATVTITVGGMASGEHRSGDSAGRHSKRPGGIGPVRPGIEPLRPEESTLGGGLHLFPAWNFRQSGIMGERNILVRALEFLEHPRQLEVAYVQWINLWHGEQNRTVVDIPPEALSVLTGTDIRSEAKLADGSPLPFWVTFDADARALLVNPPGDLTQKSTTVKVWFWDEKGNEAVVSITLNLKADTARSVAGAETRIDQWETEQTVTASPGETVEVSLPMEAWHREVLTGGQVTFSAALADGSPLPKGLALDPQTGEVSGKIPVGAGETVLEVRVIASDELGNRSEIVHRLRVLPSEGGRAARPSFTVQLAAFRA